jgi:short-subunit dehydrogenase
MAAKNRARLILANRTPDPSLVDSLTLLGAQTIQEVSLDLSDRASIDAFIDAMKDKPVDILFNNAGQMSIGQLEKQNIQEIYSMMQVNVMGLIHLTHGLLPGMLRRQKGKIINHASVMAVMQLPASSTYAASKAAVVAFNNSLSGELKGTGVNTLLLLTPGVETRMFKDIPNQVGKNFEPGVFSSSMPTSKYATIIEDAIREDLEVLSPSGLTGVFLKLAQHTPGVYKKLVSTKFHRT